MKQISEDTIIDISSGANDFPVNVFLKEYGDKTQQKPVNNFLEPLGISEVCVDADHESVAECDMLLGLTIKDNIDPAAQKFMVENFVNKIIVAKSYYKFHAICDALDKASNVNAAKAGDDVSTMIDVRTKNELPPGSNYVETGEPVGWNRAKIGRVMEEACRRGLNKNDSPIVITHARAMFGYRLGEMSYGEGLRCDIVHGLMVNMNHMEMKWVQMSDYLQNIGVKSTTICVEGKEYSIFDSYVVAPQTVILSKPTTKKDVAPVKIKIYRDEHEAELRFHAFFSYKAEVNNPEGVIHVPTAGEFGG